MKKKAVHKKRNIGVVFVLFLVLGTIIVGPKVLKKEKSLKAKPAIKIEEKIEKYDYVLNDNETSYYKDLFQKLKKELNQEPVDEEKYASLVSQLFLADFFNLDNKISKNDIGGIQFVYSEFQEDFEKLAKEGMYHHVESDVYENRKQELPVVTEVSVSNIEQQAFHYLDQEDPKAYQLDLKVTYEQDLGYQEDVTLVLAHHNDKLEIIKMTK